VHRDVTVNRIKTLQKRHADGVYEGQNNIRFFLSSYQNGIFIFSNHVEIVCFLFVFLEGVRIHLSFFCLARALLHGARAAAASSCICFINKTTLH